MLYLLIMKHKSFHWFSLYKMIPMLHVLIHSIKMIEFPTLSFPSVESNGATRVQRVNTINHISTYSMLSKEHKWTRRNKVCKRSQYPIKSIIHKTLFLLRLSLLYARVFLRNEIKADRRMVKESCSTTMVLVVAINVTWKVTWEEKGINRALNSYYRRLVF